MERKLIDRYFDEIINLNPLSVEEERNLSERILQGDGRAADKLVTANLKFVALNFISAIAAGTSAE